MMNLNTGVAAEIKEPGRAYLQVGNNEIFELFQSGYSGAPEKGAEDSRMKEYQLNTVDLSGRRKQVFSQKKTRLGEDSRTQLEALVNYVNRYCERKNIAHLPPICLPSLPELLPFPKPQPAQFADGVIVGSAIVKIIAANGTNSAPVVGEYVKQMKDAIRVV